MNKRSDLVFQRTRFIRIEINSTLKQTDANNQAALKVMWWFTCAKCGLMPKYLPRIYKGLVCLIDPLYGLSLIIGYTFNLLNYFKLSNTVMEDAEETAAAVDDRVSLEVCSQNGVSTTHFTPNWKLKLKIIYVYFYEIIITQLYNTTLNITRNAYFNDLNEGSAFRHNRFSYRVSFTFKKGSTK